MLYSTLLPQNEQTLLRDLMFVHAQIIMTQLLFSLPLPYLTKLMEMQVYHKNTSPLDKCMPKYKRLFILLISCDCVFHPDHLAVGQLIILLK